MGGGGRSCKKRRRREKARRCGWGLVEGEWLTLQARLCLFLRRL